MAEELATDEPEGGETNELMFALLSLFVDVEPGVLILLPGSHALERPLQVCTTKAASGHAQTMGFDDRELPAKSVGKWKMNSHAPSLAAELSLARALSTA